MTTKPRKGVTTKVKLKPLNEQKVRKPSIILL